MLENKNASQNVFYIQLNSASELSGFTCTKLTNSELEISIPHEAAERGIENFEFIVSKRVQVNPDNSRAMKALTFLLFKLNTLQKKSSNSESAEAIV